MSKTQARKMSQACKQHGAKMILKKRKRGKGGRGHATEGMEKKQPHKIKSRTTEGLQRDCERSNGLALRSANGAGQNQSNAACFTVREQRGGAQGPRALTLLARVHVCGQLHVVGGEEPHLSADFSFPPVGVLLVEDVDELALAEGQLVVILGGVVVHPDHLTHCRRRAG